MTYGIQYNLSIYLSGSLYPQKPEPLTPHSCSSAAYQPFYLKRYLWSKARICFYLIKIGREGKYACKNPAANCFPFRKPNWQRNMQKEKRIAKHFLFKQVPRVFPHLFIPDCFLSHPTVITVLHALLQMKLLLLHVAVSQ